MSAPPGRTTLREDERAVLSRATHGFLGLNGPRGWPLVRPLNFVLHEDRLYFHGDEEGEKMHALRADPRATFTAVCDYSLIPSYFVHPRNACPATQYYAAVLLTGRVREVSDPREKARALQALMEKLQPEGGHERIEADTALYRKAIQTTAVVALQIEDVQSKFNLGQDAAAAKRRKIEDGLERRGGETDRETLRQMRGPGRARPILETPRRKP